MVLALALLMIAVGLAFKLSAVPFHFWCPDVFEGAPAEIGGFLSVASKAAALALLVRVVAGIGWIAPEGVQPGYRTAALANAQVADSEALESLDRGLFAVADATRGHERHPRRRPLPPPLAATPSAGNRAAPTGAYVSGLLDRPAGGVTCTFGNLAAYGQTNIKRLLAYSTIAHAGYMMMAMPAVLELVGRSTPDAQAAAASLAIYIVVYLFMNLGAFAIVAFLRNRVHSEQIADYTGLLYRSPGIAICFSLILFGLVGLPPLSGFIGKFAVFAALTDAFRASGHVYLMVLFLIAGINSAISLFYYLRVVRIMTMPVESGERQPTRCDLPMLSPHGVYILLLTLPTALLMLGWEPLGAVTMAAARSLFG